MTLGSKWRIGRIHVALVVAIILVAGLWEWMSGRPPICPCGTIALWAGAVHGSENSQMVADWYSLSHLVHGLLFYGALWLVARRWSVGTRLVLATIVEATWEILENSPIIIDRYRSVTLAWGYSGDSILNSMSDICFMIVGFVLAWRLPLWGSIALGIVLELVALVAIRDNLTLNVLMLVYPVDAIRRWQGE
jgi:hypothetical protein